MDVDGRRLHVNCTGDGVPVVLLESAIAASSLSWAVVQPRIATFTRVCAYDRAGLGWSDAPSGSKTFDRIVSELSAVLASLAPGQRCVLVGHSFGSFVVRAYAARHPGDVAGLVLVDPPIEWLTPTREHRRLLRGAVQLSRIGALLARFGVVRLCLSFLTGGAPGVPRRFVKNLRPNRSSDARTTRWRGSQLPPEVHPLVQALWSEPKCFHAMTDHLLVMARDTEAIAAAIPPREIPIVVISSADQPSEQLAAHRLLTEASTNGRHVVATEGAHWVQFDEPELVAAAVRQLVKLERERSTESQTTDDEEQ